MIPMELISMLGSTVLGGVMSIMAQKGQAEAEKQKLLMQRAGFAAKQTDKARMDSFNVCIFYYCCTNRCTYLYRC
jgi:hypothetical protein